MSRGNPNQAKVVQKLIELGYTVRISHNQIHIKGIRASPFHPDDKVPEGQTYGHTITEAKEFIRINHTAMGKTEQKSLI